VAAVSMSVVVGLVISGGVTTATSETVADHVRQVMNERVPDVRWDVQVLIERVVQPPADGLDLVEAVRRMVLDRDWDVAVCVTDLPLHRGRRPVVAHTSPIHGVGIISLPALGPTGRTHRLGELAVTVLEHLFGADNDNEADSAALGQRAEQAATDVDEQGAGFTARVITGNVRLLSGMVRANQPWRLTLRLSRALTAAAAAGVFALITPDLWRMADTFGTLRLAGVGIGSVVAITAAIMIGAQLWERPVSRRSREQVMLFNIATTTTVVIGVAAFYATVFALACAAAAVLVVPAGLSDALGHRVAWPDYLELAWLTCSLATLAGALGAGLEDDDVIRHAAYTHTTDT
jgi:hypothetical protein